MRFHGRHFTTTERTPAALSELLQQADKNLSTQLYAGLLSNPLFRAYALPLGQRAPLDAWVCELFDEIGFVPQRLSDLLSLFEGSGTQKGRVVDDDDDFGPFKYRLDVVQRRF